MPQVSRYDAADELGVGALLRRREAEQFELLEDEVVDEVVPRRLRERRRHRRCSGTATVTVSVATFVPKSTVIAASPCPLT